MGGKYNLLFLAPLTLKISSVLGRPQTHLSILFSTHLVKKSKKKTRVKTAMENGCSWNVIKHLYIKYIFYSSLFYN